jgi:OOP family OmpA-OmpF porin
MKKFDARLLAAGLMTALAVPALAGAPEDSWSVTTQINAVWVDDNRNADDDVGITLGIGRTLSPNWDVELSLFGSEHDRANENTLTIGGGALLLKRVFYREGRVNPFFSFGVGGTQSNFDPGSNRTDPTGHYGVGVLIDLGPSRDDGSAMQLRGDIGARRGLSNNYDFVDYVAGLGIQYSWGGTPVRRVVDTDGDGITDDMDRCPGTPAGTPVDATGCPLPQDDDGDGVVNENDKCPGTPAGKKVDAVGCEIDGDDDGDGILNSVDQCPTTPPGERVNNVGCPFDRELILQGVKFATGSAELLPESLPILENAVATLKRYPEVRIEVAGHTDSRGAEAFNEQLSARRAASVLEYLRAGGVTNSLTSKGYGESEPIASNDTDEGRQQNRRVVLRILE